MHFFVPNLDKRKKRLLAEAENDLLDAEKGLEDATAIAEMSRKRVLRLRKDVDKVLHEEAAIAKRNSESDPS